MCGGFVGFGGPFARPPQVAADGDGLTATDGAGRWRIVADVFGTAFVRIDGPADPLAGGAVYVGADGRVRWGGRDRVVPGLAGAPSAAASATTAAVVVPDSHRIALLA